MDTHEITESVTYRRGALFASVSHRFCLRSYLPCTCEPCRLYSVESNRGTERAMLWVEAPEASPIIIEANTFGDRFPDFDRRTAGDRRAS